MTPDDRYDERARRASASIDPFGHEAGYNTHGRHMLAPADIRGSEAENEPRPDDAD